MRKIAHILNPVSVPETSDLYRAQPVTFQACQIAQAFAEDNISVSLFSAQFQEDRSIIPRGFEITSNLTRSVLDLSHFAEQRKLPLLKDILDKLYQSTDAEYLIYTNVDIAPLPHFYASINAIIDAGFDAFVINRRTISKKYDLADLPLMYADLGETHPGHDCFVFRRDAYSKYILGDVCIGARYVGRVLIWNLIYFADQFNEFGDVHLTFHLGNDQIWRSSHFQEYSEFNKYEASKILHKLKKHNGDFPKDHPIHNFFEGYAPISFPMRVRKRLHQYWHNLFQTS